MNRHRPAELIVRGLCIDSIVDAVDRLVAAGAENRRTKDLLRRGIGENLNEAESLVLLDRASAKGVSVEISHCFRQLGAKNNDV